MKSIAFSKRDVMLSFKIVEEYKEITLMTMYVMVYIFEFVTFEYRNEPKPQLKESDFENMIVKYAFFWSKIMLGVGLCG